MKIQFKFQLTILSALVLFLAACNSNQPKTSIEKEISGEYYDWKKTNAPERPWIHDYDKTMVSKIFLCSRDSAGNVDRVYLTFEQLLEVIKKIDNITLGIPKIAYLVGWQYSGHDSKYPSWDHVNDRLKRAQDSTSLQSLKWVITEAKKYNTLVSLHINMIDAFKDSPLWQEYFEKDIIAKDKSGRPIPGEVFDGMQSYQNSYAQEWKLGYAQKRIDRLLDMIPELKEIGTIHIDAFHSMRPSGPNEPMSPYLEFSMEEEMEAQRKIFRYWRSKGLDVTCEAGIYNLRRDPFLGLQPLSWHYTEAAYIMQDWMNKANDFYFIPEGLNGFTPMQCEQEVRQDPENLSGLLEQMCLKLVPWYYKRNADLSKYSNVILTDDMVISPVLWDRKTLIAYSNKDIVDLQFRIPSNWGDVKTLQVYELTVSGLVPISTIEAETIDGDGNAFNKVIKLNIPKEQPTVIKPI